MVGGGYGMGRDEMDALAYNMHIGGEGQSKKKKVYMYLHRAPINLACVAHLEGTASTSTAGGVGERKDLRARKALRPFRTSGCCDQT